MDNLCHTLVGAAMGYAGLRHKSRFANPTLMIAANLPDLDVLVFATSASSVEFRRGWTHGVLAQALLPIALTLVLLVIDRLRRPSPAGAGVGPPVSIPWLLACSYLGIYSHVFLDFLNTYGVRLLTPFEWRWFYGDAVFILDPWLWLTLGVGVWLSRRRHSPRPAQAALLIAALYVGGMVGSARASRAFVLAAWEREQGTRPVSAMVGPAPITPFRKQVIIDAGDAYATGGFTWLPAPRVTFDAVRVPKQHRRPEVAAARQTPQLRPFLVWSRFPYFDIEAAPEGTRVSAGDMRFTGGNSLRGLVGSRFIATTVVPRRDD